MEMEHVTKTFNDVKDEYEITIQMLQEQKEEYRLTYEIMKEKVFEITSENARLFNEMKNGILAEIMSHSTTDPGDITEKLQRATQEKESAMAKLNLAECQIQQQQRTLLEEKEMYRMKAIEHEANMEKLDIALHHEKVIQEQVSCQNSTVEQLQIQLKDSELKITNQEEMIQMLDARLKETQSIIQQLEHDKRVALEQLDMSTSNIELAVSEKKKAQLKEAGAWVEVERLKNVVTQLMEEAGRQTKDKIEIVTQKYNSNIHQLVDEIQTLNLAAAENESRWEKSKIERNSIQEKLSKTQEELLVKHESSDDVCVAALKRITELEQQLEENSCKMKSVELAFSTQKQNYSHKLHLVEVLNEELVSHMSILTSEKENLALEKLALSQANAQLERHLHEKISGFPSKDNGSLQNQILQLQQKFMLMEQESKMQLEMMEESQNIKIEKMENEIKFKQHLAERWRNEAEQNLAGLRNQIKFLEQQVEYWKSINHM